MATIPVQVWASVDAAGRPTACRDRAHAEAVAKDHAIRLTRQGPHRAALLAEETPLRAAAPSLLAALERLTRALAQEAVKSPKGSPMFTSDLGRADAEARAAIAKAKGA